MFARSYLVVQLPRLHLEIHHPVVVDFLGADLQERRLVSGARKPATQKRSLGRLTVMVPLPAGLLFFITSGRVSFLLDTT